MLFIEDLFVPADDLVGEEGKGFSVPAARAQSRARAVRGRGHRPGSGGAGQGDDLRQERVVFGRPIGQNQGVAHPLAKSWAELEAANLLAFKAAALYDQGQDCGAEANAAKYLGAEAGFTACEPRSWPTAAWATPRNTTSSAISGRR